MGRPSQGNQTPSKLPPKNKKSPPETPVPRNLQAERALLGGLLMEPEQIPEITRVLGGGESWYHEHHSALFWLLVEMADNGEKIDLLTVADRIQKDHHPKRFGDLAVWTGYPSLCPTTQNLDEYAKQIRRAADQRLALIATGELERAIREGGDVQTIAARLADLGGNRGKRWEGSEVPETLPIPHHYEVGRSGKVYVVRPGKSGEEVAPAPVLPRRRAIELETGEHRVELVWQLPEGGWGARWVNQEVIADSGKLTRLSAFGLPVSTLNARLLCGWLTECLSLWGRSMETLRVSASLGWREGGFLWGASPLGRVSVQLDLSDPGRRSLIQGYRANGSWEGWIEQVARPALQHPTTALLIWASIVPPLLKFLPDAPNFLVDLSGETSRGKTTALSVGASVWGDPSERGGLVWNWDASGTWIERAAALCSDLPVFLDDSKRARPGMVGQIVYSVAQGRGRGRASVEGLRDGAIWRTVLISTGEQPLGSYCPTDGGAEARILSLWGQPLPNAGVAQKLSQGVIDHHGHLGPRVILWLLGVLEGNPDWLLSRYRTLRAHVQAEMEKREVGAVAQRAAAYQSLIWLAREICLEAGLPGETCGDVWGMMNGMVQDTRSNADTATKALEVTAGWIAAHPDQFWTREAKQPNGGWAGRALSGGSVAVEATTLDRLLREHGFDAEGVRRIWSGRGWIEGKENRTTQVVRVGNYTCRCVKLTGEALELGGADIDSPIPPDLSEVL